MGLYPGSIRLRLAALMALILVGGVVVVLTFSVASSYLVKRILSRDMVQVSSLLAEMVERNRQSQARQLDQIAGSNALRVMLQLDLPAQARRFLEERLKDTPFDNFWLVDAGGRVLAGAGPDGQGASPPLAASGRARSLVLLRGEMHAVFQAGVERGGADLGRVVAATPFPDASLLESVSMPGESGLVILAGGRPAAASAWLDTGMRRAAAQAVAEGRDEAVLASGGEEDVFLLHVARLPPLAGAVEATAVRLRSLAEARAPFRYLVAAFLAGLLVIVVLFALVLRYVGRNMVRPVLKLADLAGYVQSRRRLPEDFEDWLPKRSATEIDQLYRSFSDTLLALDKARREAEEADRVKSDFLSMVSHELRTPLTSILGFAKMIRKRLESVVFPAVSRPDARTRKAMEQVRSNVGIIASEGERLTSLINDVLDLARLESGKMPWRMESVDLQALAETALAASRTMFRHKGLETRVEAEAGLPEVTADRDRIMQVLLNLLSNAAKFTDRGGVVCRLMRDEIDGREAVRVEVEDTGSGVRPEDLDKIFDKFRQAGETLTDKPKGTGLGLPICRQIVERHGGALTLETAPGRGSVFRFTLPVDGPAPA